MSAPAFMFDVQGMAPGWFRIPFTLESGELLPDLDKEIVCVHPWFRMPAYAAHCTLAKGLVQWLGRAPGLHKITLYNAGFIFIQAFTSPSGEPTTSEFVIANAVCRGSRLGCYHPEQVAGLKPNLLVTTGLCG